MKRVISLFLALLMCFTTVSVYTFAEEENVVELFAGDEQSDYFESTISEGIYEEQITAAETMLAETRKEDNIVFNLSDENTKPEQAPEELIEEQSSFEQSNLSDADEWEPGSRVEAEGVESEDVNKEKLPDSIGNDAQTNQEELKKESETKSNIEAKVEGSVITGIDEITSEDLENKDIGKIAKTGDFSFVANQADAGVMMLAGENTIVASGTCGLNLTWILDGAGTLTINGTGEMTNYGLNSRPWHLQKLSIKTVIINSGATYIADNAFGDCSNLTSIVIPDSVTYIGYDAFEGCHNLTSIVIPDSVTKIDVRAFKDCYSLASVTIGNNVTGIDINAFQGCHNLTSIVIPDSVTYIGSGAFEDCYSLSSIVIPDSVTSIGESAFEYCSSLSSVTIGNSVTNIGINVFKDCSSLTSVTIGNNVSGIDRGTFYRCSSLSSIVIPDSVTYISYDAFGGCHNLTNIVIPDSVTSIGYSAFEECTSLTSIVIPDSVTSIGGSAFEGCGSLTSIVIPDSVTSIGDWAFANCYRLTSIVIPDSVTSIGDSAFISCYNLASVTIGNSVTSIGYSAFEECTSLTSIVIPDSVTSIGYSAFEECTSLTSIVIPDSVISIGGSAFEGCSLTDVYYSGNETTWKQISIGSRNESLLNATIHYNWQKDDSFGYIMTSGTSGENPWRINLSKKFEDCVISTASSEYNPALSYYLAGLSRAVYNEADITESLNSLGFDSDRKQEFRDSSSQSLSGYSISKKIMQNGKTLVLIVIRGSKGYNWNNLLNIGDSFLGTGEYPAFQNDAQNVLDALKVYLGGLPADNTVYVITGHSQGAGAANILTTKLQHNGIPASAVYDYNFACPNIACYPTDASYWNPEGQYNNIFNIGNVEDPVTFLPSNLLHNTIGTGAEGNLSNWGKYGQSFWFFPNQENHSAAGHDMIYYLRALSYRYPISAFKTWSQVVAALAKQVTDKIYDIFSAPIKLWKVIVGRCPIDMTIYNSSGTPVAGVINNQAYYYDSNPEDVLIFIVGDEKWFYLPIDQEYDVRIHATDNGEMSYEVFDYILGETKGLTEKQFSPVILTAGKEMYSKVGGNITVPNTPLWVLDDNNTLVREIHEDGTETNIAHTHTWDDGVITTPATCIINGIKTFTCTTCGETKDSTIAALGHPFDGGICINCGETQPGFTPKLIVLASESSGKYVFKSTASFSTFLGVYVDGVKLASDYYSAYEGSTIVELKPSYIRTLAAGTHSIRIASSLGNADGTFTISQNTQTSDSIYSSNSSTVSNNQTTEQDSQAYAAKRVLQNPKTGDSINIRNLLVLTISSFVSLINLFFFLIGFKKRQK